MTDLITLLKYARRNRMTMPLSQSHLWEELQGLGTKFGLEIVLCGYIVDFYCDEYKLIVEVDGDSHIGKEVYDRVRDRVLQQAGYRIIHIEARRVFTDIQAVLTEIVDAFHH